MPSRREKVQSIYTGRCERKRRESREERERVFFLFFFLSPLYLLRSSSLGECRGGCQRTSQNHL